MLGLFPYIRQEEVIKMIFQDDSFLLVPLKLSQEEIKILAQEYEQNESSTMTIFIEKILKEANKVAIKTKENCMYFLKINPFSQNEIQEV